MNKQDVIDYIKRFNQISISNVCKDLHINIYNIYTGRASKKSYEKLYKELKRRLEVLLDEKTL